MLCGSTGQIEDASEIPRDGHEREVNKISEKISSTLSFPRLSRSTPLLQILILVPSLGAQ